MDDYLNLDVLVVRRETPKALQVVLADGMIEWFPKSQVRPPVPIAGERDITIGVSRWLLEQRQTEEDREW